MKIEFRCVTIIILVFFFNPILSSSTSVDFSGSGKYTTAERDYWPTNGWINTTPEEQGMNSHILNGMLDYIEDNDVDVKSVIVVKNGYVVLEEYLRSLYNENSTHLMYSVTKSFTSALVGIALKQGYIDNVSQLVLPFFPEYEIYNYDERRERITIEHLLTMRSGLFWDEWSAPFMTPANGIYHLTVRDGVNYTLNLNMTSEPGTEFLYNTGASHLLAAIVQVSTGMRTLDFARENLFDPLGFDRNYWYTDAAGWYKGGFDLVITTRSMAKFGYLFLNNGTWDGQQIVSKEWVNRSTTSYTEFSPAFGYGYQWWTNDEVGMYSARGLYGQYIYVVPEHDIVVAFTSDIRSDMEHPHDNLVIDYVIQANGEPQVRYDDVVVPAILVLLAVPLLIAAGYWELVLKRK